MTRYRRAAGALLAVALLAGCGGVPLPGGAAAGPGAYRVTVHFGDVLDLVPQAAVKVDDVTVGSVEQIRLAGFTAEVRVRLERRVRLPDNAVAEVRQTSLLGEKFVSLAPPDSGAAQGRLADGDVIPLARSGRSVEVEEVLSALSLLLNGGGVEQLRTINRELSAALTGREDKLRSVLRQLNTFVGGLDEQKADIVKALESLDRLTATLHAQRRTIAAALESIPPGLKVLADQRAQLVRMLGALSKLGSIGTRVINESRDDTLADLRALQPILEQLDRAGTYLPRALEILLTYPFPRTAVNGIRGDFTNLYASADLDLQNVLDNWGLAPGAASPAGGSPGGLPGAAPGGLPGALDRVGPRASPPKTGRPGDPGLADLLLGGLVP
jgi:phospholipid/cholesterol/gamma-HCH transport system substrate-binding protein